MRSTTEVYYDSANGHRLRLLDNRENEMGLYEDMDDGTRITCAHKSVDEFPRPIKKFTPVIKRPRPGEIVRKTCAILATDRIMSSYLSGGAGQ